MGIKMSCEYFCYSVLSWYRFSYLKAHWRQKQCANWIWINTVDQFSSLFYFGIIISIIFRSFLLFSVSFYFYFGIFFVVFNLFVWSCCFQITNVNRNRQNFFFTHIEIFNGFVVVPKQWIADDDDVDDAQRSIKTSNEFARIYLFSVLFHFLFFTLNFSLNFCVKKNLFFCQSKSKFPIPMYISIQYVLNSICVFINFWRWLRALCHTHIVVWTPLLVALKTNETKNGSNNSNNNNEEKKATECVTKSVKEKILWLIINLHILF